MIRRLQPVSRLALGALALCGVACFNTPASTVAPTNSPMASTLPTEAKSNNPILKAVALGIGDIYYRDLGNPGYDVTHYTLDLEFDPDPNSLVARVAITAVATELLHTFNLDFGQLSIDRLSVDGADAEFARVGNEVTIAPAKPITLGESFIISVEYSGIPQSKISDALPFEIGWINTPTDQSYVAAEPDAAHTWFPANDHPLDKATFTFRITVPRGTTGAANGTLVEQIPTKDTVTWVWELTSPMAPYLATVIIGAFDIAVDTASSELAGIPIRNILPMDSSLEDWPSLERQGEMIVFLEDLFGPFPFDTYGIAIVDGFKGALENQTLSIFGSEFVTEDLLIHELAHQWFGNSVSLAQWHDIWLNEGFASYAEWLWVEHKTTGKEFEQSITAERDNLALLPSLVPPGSPEPNDLFSTSVYRVGALTLHALRLTVGDDAFFKILRTYVDQFRDSSATTLDFITVAITVTGMDLDPLFNRWLYSKDIPQLPDH